MVNHMVIEFEKLFLANLISYQSNARKYFFIPSPKSFLESAFFSLLILYFHAHTQTPALEMCGTCSEGQ